MTCRVPEDCPQAVADCIDRCLAQDHRQRPTAAQVLQVIEESMGGAAGGPPPQHALPHPSVAAWDEAGEDARLLAHAPPPH